MFSQGISEFKTGGLRKSPPVLIWVGVAGDFKNENRNEKSPMIRAFFMISCLATIK